MQILNSWNERRRGSSIRLLEPGMLDNLSLKEICYRRITQYMARLGMMHHADGLFYLDTREPHLVNDIGAVTLTTTPKALYPAAAFPVLGGGYFNRPGKTIKISMWFKMTMPATPGNFSFDMRWNAGTDNTGTVICVTGTPVALTNATKCGYAEFVIRCLTTGTAGTLQGTGWSVVDPGVIASTLQPIMLPTAGAAASAALDLTAANIVSIQALQSGTAGTVQIQQMSVEALN